MDSTTGPVLTGIWTDHSRGNFYGRQLTYHSGDARYLIAFLTFYVGIAGVFGWIAVCFILHQTRSDGNARDGLYHQRQALFRNSEFPIFTFVSLFKMSWAWRHRAGQILDRQLPLMWLSFAWAAGFAAAAILVVRVATVGTDGPVLLQGIDTCKWPIQAGQSAAENDFGVLQSLYGKSQQYSMQCYMNATDSVGADLTNANSDGESSACNAPFTTPRILFNTQTDSAPCPFNNTSYCRAPEQSVKLASQIINSNTDLGINSNAADQVTFQRWMTCSALLDSPELSDLVRDEAFIYFNKTSSSTGIFERVFAYFENNATPMRSIWALPLSPYNLAAVESRSNASNSPQVIEDIMPALADLSIITLSNTVSYLAQSNDAIFGTEETTATGAAGGYFASKFVAFGCAHQYQFCNPKTNACTEIGGWGDIGAFDGSSFSLYDLPGLTPLQQAIISNIAMVGQSLNLSSIVNTLQGDSLLAARQITNYNPAISLGLADNQTAIEMQNLFSIGLAALQVGLTAMPLASPSTENKNVLNSQSQMLCHNQLIKNGEYTSFSVLGLSIVLAVGGLLILLGIFLSPFVRFLQRRSRSTSYRKLEWETNGLFEMQKSAFQARNLGTWSNKPTLVPVTMPFEKFQLPPEVIMGSRDGHKPSLSGGVDETRTLGSRRYMALPPQVGLSGPDDFERALLSPETQHRSIEQERTPLNPETQPLPIEQESRADSIEVIP